MGRIHLLDTDTINKIKAGEVVERPASVIKELVENSIDSGADSITVEIRNGGKSYMRVTDNGSGIEKEDIPLAFKSHATSKIRDAEDIYGVLTLGFRGEALASIASVSRVSMITKTGEAVTGVSYAVEGGEVTEDRETGYEKGTTIIVKGLFYNTPVREKYLKTAQTEGSYIKELMMRMCMAKPGITFTFIADGSEKISVSGRMDLSQLIFALYGKEIIKQLIPVDFERQGFSIKGFAGKPDLARGKRTNENYYINNRYIQSLIINKAIEDAYKPYIMAHRFPFTALYIDIDPVGVDVNVHPAKREARILEQGKIYNYVAEALGEALKRSELIGELEMKEDIPLSPDSAYMKKEEPAAGSSSYAAAAGNADTPVLKEEKSVPQTTLEGLSYPAGYNDVKALRERQKKEASKERGGSASWQERKDQGALPTPEEIAGIIKETETISFLDPENSAGRQIIGQVFGTYWLVESDDKMYMIDQHAAHEKVLFERFMKRLKGGGMPVQELLAPVVLDLQDREAELLKKHMADFNAAGFEVEEFGYDEFALRGVPMDLYGFNAKELFLEILDGLSKPGESARSEGLTDRIATMACKAAVKGNNRLSLKETEALINELMGLENPYNCPHGRPTMRVITKQEMEKFFKRIV